ncbi:MAG: PEP-CTERM sorting domain-containing protein [Planctomycetota bacterium]|jgi:hypothetical protein
MRTTSAFLIVAAMAMTASVASAGYVDTTSDVPSPTYEAEDIWYTNYTYDGLDRRIVTDEISFGSQIPPPDPSFPADSFFDVFCRIEFDDGIAPPEMWEVATTAELLITGLAWDGVDPTREFQAEIVSMELTSPSSPDVVLRESPVELSGGQITVTDLGGGLYHIDSFFDIFFDLSMQGPDSLVWSVPDVPQQLVGVPEPATLSLLAVGSVALLRRRKA